MSLNELTNEQVSKRTNVESILSLYIIPELINYFNKCICKVTILIVVRIVYKFFVFMIVIIVDYLFPVKYLCGPVKCPLHLVRPSSQASQMPPALNSPLDEVSSCLDPPPSTELPPPPSPCPGSFPDRDPVPSPFVPDTDLSA